MRQFSSHCVTYHAYRLQARAFYAAVLFGLSFIGFAPQGHESEKVKLDVLRLGLIAQEPLGGKIWMTLADGSEALLAAFNAAPGMPAYVGASLQAQSLLYDSCYRLRVESNRPVEVMGDPRVSFLTIGQ